MSKRLFKPLNERRLLSQKVESKIEEAIRNGRLTPGTKLPTEHDLCAQFGVSRTALREALRMLSARGLVRIEKGRGTYVKRLSADTITESLQLYLTMRGLRDSAVELVQARQVIEPPIAAMAATNRNGTAVEDLEDALRTMEESISESEAFTEYDLAFHRLVADASGSMLVPLLLEPLYMLVQRVVPAVYHAIDESREEALGFHHRILAAIRDQRPDAAHEAMAAHLRLSEQYIKQIQWESKEKAEHA